MHEVFDNRLVIVLRLVLSTRPRVENGYRYAFILTVMNVIHAIRENILKIRRGDKLG